MNDTKGETFEPRIIGFLCNWCSYRAADLAGTARIPYTPNVRTVRVMCSGRVDPTFVMRAFASGADGVIVAGCHPGECHYVEQNYKTLRRFTMLRYVLERMGIERERFRLVWASAAEGHLLADAFNRAADEVRQLGPLDWSGMWQDDIEAAAAWKHVATEHEEAVEVPA